MRKYNDKNSDKRKGKPEGSEKKDFKGGKRNSGEFRSKGIGQKNEKGLKGGKSDFSERKSIDSRKSGFKDEKVKRDFSEQDEADFKSVYKGRGKNQKPIFEKVHKSEIEDKKRPKKKFKNPFGNEPVEDRPNYNFDKIEKTRGQKNPSGETRLNKYIANAGVSSRREADALIEKGLVSVNGQVVKEMGYKVQKGDKVSYKGKLLNPEKPVYLLLNKPKDFITTTDDPMERKTVMSLIENACEERVFPVGRLDRNTTGLLLFTNDGELAAKLSHPSNQIKKIYQVTLDKPLTQNHEKDILDGLELEDGAVSVDDMQVLSKDRTILGLEIHVGRNRIVRRIFAHLGYDVVALDRVLYAGLDKKDLPRGRYRFLAEKEVVRLKYFT
ncbi:pseudouridine synthase [Arthrospiribacter ruber]|uniref:Pseudouridine synthase n=1 Tax=Arthrospiribacter ruber TaxID=2487934 RepID=A0A951IX35_9BACT|nr:pseudouridine synthase [Arthrospiribacter ruber]MBW3467629.1 rRNA pseudouridine synthase [Arthrospiribacter ruber]